MSSHQKAKNGGFCLNPTEEQIKRLEYNFNNISKQPNKTTIMLIAAETGLSEDETSTWFKERLAQWRKSEGLPMHCGSVMD
ncbi:hypothetical protein GDO86_001198 [Hymenochirus boettgeri]|uniref:Homeodomain-only protein n=1 Tax=Hymenochirus boettgeri TaxID=247094 RepID=A0A8T2KK44_9PIPI|nr:hypothetical protein GDO86_001198 [Hymenochirus boettgeri]